MKLDIEPLKEIHPMMPAETAAERAHLGALALQRHHESGVIAQVRFESASHEATLHWTQRPATDADQVDPRRMIEDGAEAVALSLVHAARGWVVLRDEPQELGRYRCYYEPAPQRRYAPEPPRERGRYRTY